MKELQKRDDIIIRKADKGNCLVVMTRDQYHRMAEQQLSKKAYSPYSEAEDTKAQRDISELVELLKSDPTFNKRHNAHLNHKPERTKFIYFNPKVHKNPLGDIYPGRPITDSVAAYGTGLDLIFSHYLKQLRPDVTTTVLGSLEAVIKLEEWTKRTPITSSTTLLCVDIEDMYTSIPLDDALKRVKKAFTSKKLMTKQTAFHLCTAMEILLTKKVVHFGNRKLMQRDGVGMGDHCAAILADWYVYETVEKPALDIDTQHEGFKSSLPAMQGTFYARLLDDGLIITANPCNAKIILERISNANPALRFTHELSQKRATFLDLQLTIQDCDDGQTRLIRGVQIKETANLAILHCKSDHPWKTKMRVIRGRFQWFFRCCTGSSELASICCSFLKKLTKLGYSPVDTIPEMLAAQQEANTTNWPFVKTPSERIRTLLQLPPRQEKPSDDIWRRGSWSQNLSAHTHQLQQEAPANIRMAKSFGPNLRSLLTSSNHDRSTTQ